MLTEYDDLNLSINTDMLTIVRAMAQPESGLEIRDRMWLKITIPNAFIGKCESCMQPRNRGLTSEQSDFSQRCGHLYRIPSIYQSKINKHM